MTKLKLVVLETVLLRQWEISQKVRILFFIPLHGYFKIIYEPFLVVFDYLGALDFHG